MQGAGITLTRLTIGVSGPLAFPWRCPRCRRFRRRLHQGFQQLIIAVSQISICVLVAEQWAQWGATWNRNFTFLCDICSKVEFISVKSLICELLIENGWVILLIIINREIIRIIKYLESKKGWYSITFR